MKGIKHIFVVAGALALGCGGSQGVSGFPDPPLPLTFAPTGPGIAGGTTMRTLRAGDTWEYDVRGTMLREEFDFANTLLTKNSGPVTGTMVRTVSAVTFNFAPAFKVSEALTYKLNGGLITVEVLETYVRQEATGELTMLGRRQNKTDFAPVTPGAVQAWLPNTFALGSNVGGASTLSATPQANYTTSTAFSVTGANSVNASTGTPFTTWRSVFIDSMKGEWNIVAHLLAGRVVADGFVYDSVEDVSSVDDWSPVVGAPIMRKYGSTRRDNVVHGDLEFVGGVLTFKHHTILRTLDLEMVLKRRSLS
jgi:hypothetical protein